MLTVIAIATTAYLAMAVNDRDPPTTTLKIEINPAPAIPGSQIKISYDVIRHRVCRTVYNQSILDATDTRWDLPEQDLDIQPQDIGEEVRAIAVRIPEHAAPGPARYRNVRYYYCNIIHRFFNWPIVVAYNDVPFTIGSP